MVVIFDEGSVVGTIWFQLPKHFAKSCPRPKGGAPAFLDRACLWGWAVGPGQPRHRIETKSAPQIAPLHRDLRGKWVKKLSQTVHFATPLSSANPIGTAMVVGSILGLFWKCAFSTDCSENHVFYSVLCMFWSWIGSNSPNIQQNQTQGLEI